jgi:hypothetical protein
MKVEIVKEEYNPVAEFLSPITSIPETHSVWKSNDAVKQLMTSRSLELELNELRELLGQTQELCHEYLDAKIKAERERDKALEFANKLADECERILGLGLHQNTLPRFKAALKAWRENN